MAKSVFLSGVAGVHPVLCGTYLTKLKYRLIKSRCATNKKILSASKFSEHLPNQPIREKHCQNAEVGT